MVRLAEEMVTRGYDVTFISHDAVQELATAANLKVLFAGLLFVSVIGFLRALSIPTYDGTPLSYAFV